MTVYVDTSVLFSLLDKDDADHEALVRTWETMGSDVILTTTNYILVETLAVCQRRLGLSATRLLENDFAPILNIEWVDRELHEAGIAMLLAANRRDLSLVDCVSFETMRRLGIRHAFALDEHFREQGFEVVP